MRNIILALFLVSTAKAGPLINGNQINPASAIVIATMTVSGPLTASTGTFTGGTASQYSVYGSSTIYSATDVCISGKCLSQTTLGANMSGSGTVGTIPYFSGTNSLLSSQIVRDGSASLTVGGSSVTVAGICKINGGGGTSGHTPVSGTYLVLDSASQPYLSFLMTGNSNEGFFFGDDTSNQDASMIWSSNPKSLTIKTNGQNTTAIGILNNGNVGVGTASPATNLNVIGGILTTTETVSGYFRVGVSSLVVAANGDVGVGTVGPVMALDVAGSGEVSSTFTVIGNAFSVGGSTLVVSGGNVGIGTTSPAFNLDLGAGSATSANGWLRINGAINDSYITMSSGTASNQRLYTLYPLSGGKLSIFDYGSGTDAFVLDRNGNVGIGTTSPATTLDVNGSETLELGTTGAVLCLTSSHVIGHCTSGASCLTTCTCTCTAN